MWKVRLFWNAESIMNVSYFKCKKKGCILFFYRWTIENRRFQWQQKVLLWNETAVWVNNVFKHILRRPPRGSGEQGNNVIYFRGTGEHESKNEGNRITKVISGSREHWFWFWGTRKIQKIFRGTREQVHPPPRPPEGLSDGLIFVNLQCCNRFCLVCQRCKEYAIFWLFLFKFRL